MRIIFALLLAFSAYADEGGVNTSKLQQNDQYNPWTFRFFQLGSIANEKIKEGGSNYFSYNYFYLKKRIDYDTSYRIALPFLINTPGRSDSPFDLEYDRITFDNADMFIGYIDKNLMLLPGDIGTYSEFRYYFPTSDKARQSQRIGILKTDLILQKKLSARLWLQSWLKLKYFMQSNTVYRREVKRQYVAPGQDAVIDYVKQTENYQYEVPLELIYNGNKVSYGLGFTYKHTDFHAAKKEKRPSYIETHFSYGPQVTFNIVRDWRTMVKVEQSFFTNARTKMSEEKVDPSNDDSYKILFLSWIGFRDLL